MAIISNGTTIASGGSLSVSANPPSTVGAVGTYALLRNGEYSDKNAGDTQSGGNLTYCSAEQSNFHSGTPSGTWRIMGRARNVDNNNNGKNCIYIRIS